MNRVSFRQDATITFPAPQAMDFPTCIVSAGGKTPRWLWSQSGSDRPLRTSPASPGAMAGSGAAECTCRTGAATGWSTPSARSMTPEG